MALVVSFAFASVTSAVVGTSTSVIPTIAAIAIRSANCFASVRRFSAKLANRNRLCAISPATLRRESRIVCAVCGPDVAGAVTA